MFCLFLNGEDDFWAAPFGQGQSSPQPSTPEHLPVSLPPDVMSFTCAGWTWAAVPFLDKLGDNTLVSTFFFESQLQYYHSSLNSTLHIVETIVVFKHFLEASWNGSQVLVKFVSSFWLIFLFWYPVSCQTAGLASHFLVPRRGSFYCFIIYSSWIWHSPETSHSFSFPSSEFVSILLHNSKMLRTTDV